MSLDDQLIAAALEAGRDAAALQRDGAGRLPTERWSEKGAADFVTEVDRESERRIIRHLRARFPTHRFLAEEGTEEEGDTAAGRGLDRDVPVGGEAAPDAVDARAADEARIRWIIDPLDGTTNWLHGYPEWAVSVAALDDRGLRAAVVINAATGEEFDAIRGRGSRRDGEPIEVSGVEALHLSLIGTGFPFKRKGLLPPYLEALGRVLERTSGVRRAGAAALDLCDLACGRLDGFWELWLMPWDIAAGALIVREAGGGFEALRLEGDPELEAAGEAAARFCALLDGAEGTAAALEGGSYIAGNPAVLSRLKDVVGAA